jgi:hypothetical protein
VCFDRIERDAKCSGDPHAERFQPRLLHTPDAEKRIGWCRAARDEPIHLIFLRGREPSAPQRLYALHLPFALDVDTDRSAIAQREQDQVTRVAHIEMHAAGDDGFSHVRSTHAEVARGDAETVAQHNAHEGSRDDVSLRELAGPVDDQPAAFLLGQAVAAEPIDVARVVTDPCKPYLGGRRVPVGGYRSETRSDVSRANESSPVSVRGPVAADAGVSRRIRRPARPLLRALFDERSEGGDGLHNLLSSVGACHEESQARGGFAHRRGHHRLDVDAAFEQRLRQAH